MKINLTSVYVDDQQAAMAFYTQVLGFVVRHDVPLGTDSWLTVVSPEAPDGPELLLEPIGHPAVQPYRQALRSDSIAAAQFEVTDVAAEHARLSERGVIFTLPPTDVGTAVIAVLDDTCGNLIQLLQPKPQDGAGNTQNSLPDGSA